MLLSALFNGQFDPTARQDGGMMPPGFAGPLPQQGFSLGQTMAALGGGNANQGSVLQRLAAGFGRSLQQQQQQGAPAMPQMPMLPGMQHQGMLAELLNSVGQRRNYLGQLGQR